MSRFAPVRASSPRRSRIKSSDGHVQDFLDNSRTSILSSVPELTDLTPDQIEFIDTVIRRASATATNFLSVFKAYNEVLQERGLDPQHEVVYYGKLLKLGTLKGKNWGEKWEMVKRQQSSPKVSESVPIRSSASRLQTPLTRAKVLTRLTGALKAIERDDDAFTLTSRPGNSEADTSDAASTSEAGAADDTPRNYVPLPPPRRSVSPTLTTNSLGLSTVPPTSSYQPRSTNHPYVSRQPYSLQTAALWDAETSDGSTDTARVPSTVPPSYRAATRDANVPSKTVYTPLRALAQAHSRTVSSNGAAIATSCPVAESARAAVDQARQRKGSVINENDAWKNIKMAQDEKIADQFREDRLVERCWDIWRQMVQWIITTNQQISQARESLVVRQTLHRWRMLTIQHCEVYGRVALLSDRRCLRAALHIWKEKLKQRRQMKWRQDMRSRMKIVRDNHDQRLKQDVWAVWKQAYHLNVADQVYCKRLLLGAFATWKAKKHRLTHLERTGDQLILVRERSHMEKCWSLWRRAMELRNAENVITVRVALRILSNAVDAWRRRLQENQEADRHYDVSVLKRTLLSWKAAKARLTVRDRRASKHIARQNDVLIRAVWRVWKAHERGKLLERLRAVRLLRQVWQKWRAQLRAQQSQEDLAVAFSLRSSSVLASSTLQRWYQVYKSHRNAEAYAASYYALRLKYKTLDTWRLQQRSRLQQLKAAKKAEKFLVMRDTWKTWLEKLADRRRGRQVVLFEKRFTQKYFREWLQRAQAEQQRKVLGDIMEQRVTLRIMVNALNHWTTRVADIKFRELEVAQQSNREVLTAAFKKWKHLCIRHVEELSLMESYQDVKREEHMRRVFYRWLAAARKSRHKRLLLQEKEEQLKVGAMARAWDKWREQYLHIRLQPMADAFLVQSQQNLVFRAFGIWHSKSTSLPAIRFHASHLKAKYWKTWRDSMPRALQSKKAREKDQKAVLSKAFAKWLQAYKTKLELKAVARARYLRLPTAAPRQIGGPLPRTAPPPKAQSARENDKPLISSRSSSPVDGKREPVVRPRPNARPFPGRLGIASLLSERPRSPERLDRRSRPKRPSSPSHPKLSTRAGTTREPSPARSTTSFGGASRYSEPLSRLSALPKGGEIGRSQLWQELRAIQLRTKALAETPSYTKDPA